MKYFKYELHLAQNMDGVSEEDFNRNDKEWQQNVEEYHELFQLLEDRLPIGVIQHFSSWGFHDYRLTKLNIEHKSLRDVNVHFTISSDIENKEQEKLWLLSFDNVSFFQFQHYNYGNDKSVFHPEIDDWLYQEFIPINESTVSFEVLLASGGNILLHFPDKSVSIKNLK